jgi:multidrug efflux pump subunit AcrB
LILGFTSKSLSPEQITAYVSNVISPEIYGVNGISQILVWGAKNYAMRIWLDTQSMAKLGVVPGDVWQALQNNNVQATPGQLKGHYIFTNINLKTDLHEARDFNNLVVKNDNGRLIKIQDIGHAELGAQDYDYGVTYAGQPAIFAGVSVAPDANPLTVIGQVRALFPAMDQKMPPGLSRHLVLDSTQFISASIDEVIKTFIEAVIIVVLVIFLFLGSPRAVLIPVITIPLSLVGVCFIMYLLGYSLNLLTLLAMILAIGLVVDDAIVMLENIHRYIEQGQDPMTAA